MVSLLLACAVPPATWDVGVDLSEVQVVPIAWDEGVHPDTSVLDDPSNPFAGGVGAEKWEVLAADCAPGFYAFATALAQEATGEHQYYAASCLHALYDGARLAPDDTLWGWSAAVRGYQAVLDDFPDDVTYDASGTVAWPLAPLAFHGIEALGATPEGWVEVVTEDGGTAVVPEGSGG